MRRERIIYIIGTRVTVLLTIGIMMACTDGDGNLQTTQDGKVAVRLALDVSSSQTSKGNTRMVPTAVSGETFPGVRDLYTIPFIISADNDTVEATDHSVAAGITDFHNEDGTHHYMASETDLQIGTNAFLCYAKAAPIGSDYVAATDGSLTTNLSTVVTGASGVDPQTMTFELTPIQTTHATEAAIKILEYLNSIATAGGWNDQPDGSEAANLFKDFVNNSEGLAGSSRNVIVYVNAWYGKVSNLAGSLGTDIQSAIHSATYVTLDGSGKVETIIGAGNYPDGLPDGGAVIKWNQTYKKFEYEEVKWNNDLSKYEHKDNYDRFADYVYPAARYYYANSRIYTSNTSRQSDYTKTAWSDVLDTYENQGTDAKGVAVDAETRSVAVKNPLSYGVACMEINIKAKADPSDPYLRDDRNQHETDEESKVPLGSGIFPLTAVIIGSQVKQGYTFEPLTTTDKKEYLIYDTNVKAVKTTGGSPATFYLGETNTATDPTPVYTLGLQTKDDVSLKVVLEFENNSNKDYFISENGVIYKGTKFYLVASVVPTGADGYKRRVLTRGYKTTVNLTIGSLKTAYNALPNLKSDELRLFDTVEAGITKWQRGEDGKHEVYNW